MTRALIAIVAGSACAGLAAAEPYVFMYTSSGTLLRGQLGTDDYEVVGQSFSHPDWFTPNSILSLETASNGRLYANFTYDILPDGTYVSGLVAEISRSTGHTDYLYSLSDDSAFAGPTTGLAFGGGMAYDGRDGSFWMLNWHFAGTGPIYLHQFDVATGEILYKVETELANDMSGAMVFRDDGMLTNISYSQRLLTVIDPTTGATITETALNGPSNITGLTQYDGVTYLATQYGDMYSFDLDTFDYQLVSSFGIEYGTTWGLTVNPTPGTIVPVLAGLGIGARRRRR